MQIVPKDWQAVRNHQVFTFCRWTILLFGWAVFMLLLLFLATAPSLLQAGLLDGYGEFFKMLSQKIHY